jgi:biotin carboxyl carrier protein
MKLRANIGADRRELKIRQDGQRLFALIENRQYELTVASIPGGLLLTDGYETYECLVSNGENRNLFEVHLRGVAYEVLITDPKRLRSLAAAGGNDHGAAKVMAPMPGKVVRVMVEVGQRIDAGMGVVVVEAMKMQNEMKSPKSGVVVSLNAKQGSTVNAGDVLAVIE